jgi:hypothetical protein
MELRLTFLHDPDKDFAVRICMPVRRGTLVVTGSVQKPCEECEQMVWYNTEQVLPEEALLLPEVVLCMRCATLHMEMDDEPPTFFRGGGNA